MTMFWTCCGVRLPLSGRAPIYPRWPARSAIEAARQLVLHADPRRGAQRDRLEEFTEALVRVRGQDALEPAVHAPARAFLLIDAVAVHQGLVENHDMTVGNIDPDQMRLDRFVELFGAAQARHTVLHLAIDRRS